MGIPIPGTEVTALPLLGWILSAFQQLTPRAVVRRLPPLQCGWNDLPDSFQLLCPTLCLGEEKWETPTIPGPHLITLPWAC